MNTAFISELPGSLGNKGHALGCLFLYPNTKEAHTLTWRETFRMDSLHGAVLVDCGHLRGDFWLLTYFYL